MALPFYNWSRTASNNATADSTVNWAEGQSPSSVNDSARAMMASTAAFRDDVSGAITTGGTSTAYTVATYQVFDTLAHLNGQMVAFTPHVTCGATVTLNVDGLGAKPLRLAPTGLAGFPNVELQAGVLIQGTPYVATYNNSDSAFYLQGFMPDPFSIPLGSSIDYWGSSAPSSAFALAYGQAISRTTYSSLFSLLGTTYGTGDGSTTFNIPDLRGRVIAGKDDMGGSAASRLTSTYFGTSATALGASGGSQSHTLTLGELPTGITSANTGSISLSVSTGNSGFYTAYTTTNTSGSATGGGSQVSVPVSPGGTFGSLVSSGNITAGNAAVTSNNTSGNAHAVVPPTIIANKLLRII